MMQKPSVYESAVINSLKTADVKAVPFWREKEKRVGKGQKPHKQRPIQCGRSLMELYLQLPYSNPNPHYK